MVTAHPMTFTTAAGPVNSYGQLTSTGFGRIRVRHDLVGVLWVIEQMAIACNPTGAMDLTTAINNLPALSPVTVLSGACAQGLPSIVLRHHDEMIVTVSSGPPLAAVTLTCFLHEETGT